MKSWGIIIVTALGFLMGLILAGVGVTSAKTLFSSEVTGEKTVDQYWLDSDLSTKELQQLISNTKCQSSEKYFLACVNSLITVLPKYQLVLSTETGALSTATQQASIYDGKSEKENLAPFVKMYEKMKNRLINFESAWALVLEKEPSESMKSMVVGQGINSFLSVYKDPHTYILPTRYYEEVGSRFERSQLFVGVSFEKQDAEIFIRKVIRHSDAEEAGLKPQDQLLSINGRHYKDLNLSDFSAILRDPGIKSFQFFVRRGEEELNLEVKRSYKRLNHVTVEKESGLRDYSVISLSKFNAGACSEITKKIKELSHESVSGLVLDLRDNPGGELIEVACIAGLFIGINKKIYSVKYFEPLKSEEVVLTTGSLLYTGPLVVLINSSSASASELLAGALQEYNRAVLVGERSFGKGTFQESEVWSKNAKISIFRTHGFYLLPSGASPQLKGVTPDFIQEGGHKQIREENVYFNPIAASEDFLPQLNGPVKQSKFADEFKKCLPNISYGKNDAILKKGLDVLSCHRISSMMATQFSSEDFN